MTTHYTCACSYIAVLNTPVYFVIGISLSLFVFVCQWGVPGGTIVCLFVCLISPQMLHTRLFYHPSVIFQTHYSPNTTVYFWSMFHASGPFLLHVIVVAKHTQRTVADRCLGGIICQTGRWSRSYDSCCWHTILEWVRDDGGAVSWPCQHLHHFSPAQRQDMDPH